MKRQHSYRRFEPGTAHYVHSLWKDTHLADRYVDLHVHTNFSDSNFSPEQVVEFAAECGLSAIAVTDHDEIDGIDPTTQAGRALGLEVVPGVEFSCKFDQSEIHIVGLEIDHTHPRIADAASELKENRIRRAKTMVDKLAELGMPLDFDELLVNASPGSVGRPHIARALFAKGYVDTFKDAFRLYISRDKPGYAPRISLAPADAIRRVTDSGGVAILGHPALSKCDRDAIDRLVAMGIEGLEAYHSGQTEEECEKIVQLAHELGLLVTGGSDCHGPGAKNGPLIGKLKVPYRLLEDLREYRAARTTN
jgi:predicted metal-dependent phosphoesterase TrpH